MNWCGFMSMQIPNVVRVGVDTEWFGEVVGKEEGEGKGRTRGTVSQPVGDSCAQVSSV